MQPSVGGEVGSPAYSCGAHFELPLNAFEDELFSYFTDDNDVEHPGADLWFVLGAETATFATAEPSCRGAVPPAPSSWQTLVPPTPPTEVRLPVISFSAEQANWTYAAAIEAVAKYHTGQRFEQCELVEEAEDISNCTSGGNDGVLQLAEAASHAGLTALTGTSLSGQLDFAEVETEIRADRPIIARLTNVVRDGVAAGDEFVVVNGFDEANDGVHFIVLSNSQTDPAAHVTASGAMPLADFADRTEPLEYSDGTVTREMTWEWAGYAAGYWGPVVATPNADPNEFYSNEELSRVVSSSDGTPALLALTLRALELEGISFHCPVTPASLQNAVGNQDLRGVLNAFWVAHALGSFATNIVGLPAPLGIAAIPRSMGLSEAAYQMGLHYAGATAAGAFSALGPDTSLGFSPLLMAQLWSIAVLDGVCAL